MHRYHRIGPVALLLLDHFVTLTESAMGAHMDTGKRPRKTRIIPRRSSRTAKEDPSLLLCPCDLVDLWGYGM
jgi:hypothetical protein